jgi:putative addiction module component (TIGR02574 family)
LPKYPVALYSTSSRKAEAGSASRAGPDSAERIHGGAAGMAFSASRPLATVFDARGCQRGHGPKPRWYISGMPHSLPLPPPGFDALPVEDQIEYVQSLWDRIAATAGQVPLQDWQQALLEERLAEHRRAPDEARPWEEVIERVQERLRNSR